MIVAAELVGEMAYRGLIIPSAVNPGKPSRPDPSGQGHSFGGALYLDRWDLARTLGGRVDGRRDDQQDRRAGAHEKEPQDHRAINVQLATVPDGQSRCPADIRTSWSGRFSGRITKLAKLIVRVRFPSPAPM